MQSESKLIDPIYRSGQEDTLVLKDGPVVLQSKGKTKHGIGTAMLRLNHGLTLTIEAKLEKMNGLEFLGLGALDFTFANVFDPASALIKQIEVNSAADTKLSLLPNPQRMVFNSGERLKSVTFHVVNFPHFINLSRETGGIFHENKWLGSFSLAHFGWTIEVQEFRETENTIKHLTENGGFGLTHVGMLCRADGSLFEAQQAQVVLQHLYLFLSFAKGAWCPPMLSVGFSSDGKRVHEDWGIRITTPWESRNSWFDIHHPEWLTRLYPGFVSLLLKRELGKAVSNALYWYLRSNRGGDGAGIDSGIILSQAALERIASVFLDSDGYIPKKADNAAKRLREAFRRLDIPTAIDDQTPALSKHKGGAWRDGPEAITKVRNELVHPEGRLPFKVGTVIPDTWRLSQRYIELLILRLAGYQGDHSNRLAARWIGEVEPVPWASRSK